LQMSKLKILKLANFRWYSSSQDEVTFYQTLQTLDLFSYGIKVLPNFIEKLEKLRKLRVDLPFTYSLPMVISKMKTLTSLEIAAGNCSPDVVRNQFSGLTNLKELVLSRRYKTIETLEEKNPTVQYTLKLPKSLSKFSGNLDDAIKLLKKRRSPNSLKTLNVVCKTLEQLNVLKNIPSSNVDFSKLKSISMDCGERISLDTILSSLTFCSHIEELVISSDHMTPGISLDDSLKCLQPMTSLKKLHLSGSCEMVFTTHHLQYFQFMESLEELSLLFTFDFSEGSCDLARLTKLKYLKLWYLNQDDSKALHLPNGLRLLANTLESLCLWSNVKSEDGNSSYNELFKLKNLKHLEAIHFPISFEKVKLEDVFPALTHFFSSKP